MAALGLAYGFLAKRLLYMPLGFYGYIVEFFIFLALGKALHRVASYKQGAKVLGSAVLGLLVGLAFSPLRDVIVTSFSQGAGSDYAISEYLISLAIMCFGVFSPYFRR
jgi:hypothetical protein